MFDITHDITSVMLFDEILRFYIIPIAVIAIAILLGRELYFFITDKDESEVE